MNLHNYYIFVLLVLIPVLQIFRKTGLKPYWPLLLVVPYIGFSLCAGVLAFARWPEKKS